MLFRAPSFAAHMPISIVIATLFFWSGLVGAFSLGTPRVLSQPGQPIRAEIPVKVSGAEVDQLDQFQVFIPGKAAYDRLGISSSILEFNPKVSLDRREGKSVFIFIETALPVSKARTDDDPFMDIMLTLQWPSGQSTKNYTLLLGDSQKVTVRPGQTLSEIAAQMAPLYDGATLDQTMLALYKANPDAFSGGSIHRLPAGVELIKPSQSLVQSITPAQAYQFVDEANQSWMGERASGTKSGALSNEISAGTAKDRLSIGPGADDQSDLRRYTEEIVAQEKLLEQTRERIVELEKNIADLQKLLDAGKSKSVVAPNEKALFDSKSWGPGALALGLIALTGLLLWFMARQARRSELNMTQIKATVTPAPLHSRDSQGSVKQEMPERAKSLLAGINLDLSTPTNKIEVSNHALRVKLNLAKAYITIEDFAAAKHSLDEIVSLSAQPSNRVDASIAEEARALLLQINQRSA